MCQSFCAEPRTTRLPHLAARAVANDDDVLDVGQPESDKKNAAVSGFAHSLSSSPSVDLLDQVVPDVCDDLPVLVLDALLELEARTKHQRRQQPRSITPPIESSRSNRADRRRRQLLRHADVDEARLLAACEGSLCIAGERPVDDVMRRVDLKN